MEVSAGMSRFVRFRIGGRCWCLLSRSPSNRTWLRFGLTSSHRRTKFHVNNLPVERTGAGSPCRPCDNFAQKAIWRNLCDALL